MGTGTWSGLGNMGLCGAMAYRAIRCRAWGQCRVWDRGLWGPMGQGVGLGRVRLCSVGSVGRAGSLCSMGGQERCWPHTTSPRCEDLPEPGALHRGRARPWPPNTRPPQCPAGPPALLRSQYQSLGRSQQESAHRRNLLHSSGFRNSLNRRIPLFQTTQRGVTQRVNCNETPFGFRRTLAALHPGIYSTVNFERVQRAGKTPAGDAGRLRQSWRLPRVPALGPRQSSRDPLLPRPGPRAPRSRAGHPVARQHPGTQGPQSVGPPVNTPGWPRTWG